ncbi:hypothetical protein EV421DRAFT_1738590 [Armillaria borealis]|uniref:Uncharacterized protein n=1 Tax=Armillaria borealis TaxID=47425 RepID=A0AA39MLX0_9AGAR|nr:hypothetical protein EV421DRAFT_1738590 [Armillaria borealis]
MEVCLWRKGRNTRRGISNWTEMGCKSSCIGGEPVIIEGPFCAVQFSFAKDWSRVANMVIVDKRPNTVGNPGPGRNLRDDRRRYFPPGVEGIDFRGWADVELDQDWRLPRARDECGACTSNYRCPGLSLALISGYLLVAFLSVRKGQCHSLTPAVSDDASPPAHTQTRDGWMYARVCGEDRARARMGGGERCADMRREHARAVRKEENTSPESERTKTIAEGDGLWLYQGMALGDMSIRVQQRCDVGAWSLERQVFSWSSSTITGAASPGPSLRQERIQQPRSDGPNGEATISEANSQSNPVLFPSNALLEQFPCLPRHFPSSASVRLCGGKMNQVAAALTPYFDELEVMSEHLPMRG